jgi:hypothetical protein
MPVDLRAYVRQQTPARQQTSASTSAYVSWDPDSPRSASAYVRLRQHTSARILTRPEARQHTYGYVSIRQRLRQHTSAGILTRPEASRHAC